MSTNTIISELARKIKDLGFVVYLGNTKTYGLYSDNHSVVYFQYEPEGIAFSGKYTPNKYSGSGWAISKPNYKTKIGLQSMLDQNIPAYCLSGGTIRKSSLEEILKFYKNLYTEVI